MEDMSEVEVFADVWCPFTHVGLRRFVDHRRETGASTSACGFGRGRSNWSTASRSTSTSSSRRSPRSERSSRPTSSSGSIRSRFPTTTLPALELTGHAYRASTAVGEAVALELRDRLFERGEDIGSPDVLAEVAAAHGLDAAAADSVEIVESDWAEGTSRGNI